MIKRNKKIILLIIMMLLFSTVYPGISLANATDVKGHWAEKQINHWLSNGLAKGYQDNSFKPDDGISRAEFVTLANKAFGYTEQKEITYADVSSEDWFAGEIARAARAGYLTGYGDGTVRPEARVTRQEAASMLAKILKLDTANNSGAASDFSDAHSIPAWSRGAVGALRALGYMPGYPDNTFGPEKEISRAEAVAVLDKARTALLEAAPKDVAYDKPGVYGPASGKETVTGNVSITAPGVTLRNTVITGDLRLGEDSGNGETTLTNITVQGQTIIAGGGAAGVKLDNSSLQDLVIRKNGARVEASGSTGINTALLETGAVLVEENTSGSGFTAVTVAETTPADSRIELNGDFTDVSLYAAEIHLSIAGGTVESLEASKEAGGSTIDIARNAGAERVTLNAAVSVTGKGKIETARVNVPGCVFAQEPETIKLAHNITVRISSDEELPGAEATGGDDRESGPLEFLGAFIARDGRRIDGAGVPANLKIRLVFDRGVVDTHWENNKNCIFMETSSGEDVPIDVTRIAGLDSDKRYIYVQPFTDLTPGSTYRITIDDAIRADSGRTLEDEETVVFGVAPASGDDGDD